MDNFVDWCISTFIWIITMRVLTYLSNICIPLLPENPTFNWPFHQTFRNQILGKYFNREFCIPIFNLRYFAPGPWELHSFVLQTFRHWTFCCRTFCCWTFRCRTFHCQIFCCLTFRCRICRTFRCRICRTFRCWLFNFGYFVIVPFNHCSGSLTFWYGSESADPYHGSGSCSFLQWNSKCQQKVSFFFKVCYCFFLIKGIFTLVF